MLPTVSKSYVAVLQGNWLFLKSLVWFSAVFEWIEQIFIDINLHQYWPLNRCSQIYGIDIASNKKIDNGLLEKCLQIG